ncbi:MAG TPA: alpha/beta fold hydrolase [Herpetosiphonaceae bacterium]
MPFTTVQGLRLYYDVHGHPRRADTPPLLLIAGLGFSTWCWFKQLPALAEHHQVIVFDNRGTGRSEKPRHPYSVTRMVEDTIGLLDALDVRRAHVLGTSLGGFVAQELAARHPARVGRLVLCCTSYGGPRSVPMSWSALSATLGWGSIDRTQAILRGLRIATSQPYCDEHLDELVQIAEWRQSDPLSRADYFRQVMAGVRFDGLHQARTIAAPTLVLHGTDDRVVPVANARLLGAALPDATVHLLDGAGHLVFIERAAQVNRMILDFLEASAQPAYGQARSD